MRGVIDSHLSDGVLDSLAADVRHGLRLPLKEIPPKYFYDARGSELFEQITKLPEYYPTRCERDLLNRHAPEIVELTGAGELVELGSGTASKTRALLYAMAGRGQLRAYVPFDCSETVVRECIDLLADLFPGIALHGVVGDFESHLEEIPPGHERLTAFLGGTIGNFNPNTRRSFLARIASLMYPEDRFLLGTDLVKQRARLEAAYNDSAGVTAEFNKNVLHVLNRELDADFDPAGFEHHAFWDEINSWIDIRLRSLADQTVTISALDMQVEFSDQEEMRTEISSKFTREQLEASYCEVGLEIVEWWTDPEELFALSLARAT